MTCIITSLRLLLIIPTGLSKLRDTVGLILWTGLSIGILAFFFYMNKGLIYKNFNSHDFYQFFTMTMFTLNPAILLIGTIPAIHHLASKDYDLLKSKAVRVDDKLLFMLDILLCASSSIAGIVYFIVFISQIDDYGIEKGAYMVSLVSLKVAEGLLMMLATYIIAAMMAQLSNNPSQHINLKWAEPRGLVVLQRFVKIKEGVSPLIFIIYTVKCSMLILDFVRLVARTDTVSMLNLSYYIYDIVYINTVASHAFEYVQSQIMELR